MFQQTENMVPALGPIVKIILSYASSSGEYFIEEVIKQDDLNESMGVLRISGKSFY